MDDAPTIPAPWRSAGRAAIECQALVLPLDQNDTGVVRPGVRLWRSADVSAALGAIGSTPPIEAAPVGALADHLLALWPEGDFRSTARVRLTSIDRAGEDWVFGFDVEHPCDPDGDPAPAHLCVLLRFVADASLPCSLRFDFAMRSPAAHREIASLSLRLC